MRTSVFMAGNGFVQLRIRIAEIEGRGAKESGQWLVSSDESSRASQPPDLIRGEGKEKDGKGLSPVLRRPSSILPFAIPRLDRMLGGGLARAALHEMRVPESRDTAAMTGFAAAILSAQEARSAEGATGKKKSLPILWIVEVAAANEAGFIYGSGLAAFGLDPGRLVVVRVKTAADALWVFEEGLRCSGLAAVVTEIRGNPRLLDLTASRRLALRAAEAGVMGLLLRQTDRPEPGAATTRWLVAPRPASVADDFPAGIGNPAWRLVLERNRLGATGTFDLEWDHDRRCFLARAAPALSRPVAPLPRDRPSAPPDVRPLVAYKRPSLAGRIETPRERKRRQAWTRG